MKICEAKIKVRYSDTDQMGVAHHSNYFRYFEEARGELFLLTGMSYGQVENDGIMLPLSEASCKYVSGAKYEDTLIIKVWVEKITVARIIFEYEIINKSDNLLIATGRTVHGFTNLSLKPVNLKKANNKVWEKINSLLTLD
jgi:acyl-CoA thioester hydrolase